LALWPVIYLDELLFEFNILLKNANKNAFQVRYLTIGPTFVNIFLNYFSNPQRKESF
jgi:hypothetical protein